MAATNSFSNSSIFEDDEFSEKLIQLVSEYPSLYNKSDSNYKDARVRENIWQHIATQMNTTADIVSKRWKGIRDSFNRRNRETLTKSGQAAKKVVQYKFHHQLSFLESHHTDKSSVSNFESIASNVSSDEEVEVVTDTPGQTISTTSTVTPGKRRKLEKPDPLSDGILTYLKERSLRPNASPQKERDPDELWLLSLAPTLGRFNDYQKGIAKLNIQQVLLDVEFGTGIQNRQQNSNQSYEGATFYNL